MPTRGFWLWSLVAIAVTKILVGLGATVIATAAAVPASPRVSLLVAIVIVFAAAGTVLFGNHRRDERAGVLGALFLAASSVFADPLLSRLGEITHGASILAYGVMSLQVDAFSPALLWQFGLTFPRVPESRRTRRLMRLALRASVAIGTLLFFANALLFVSRRTGTPLAALQPLARFNQRLYWSLVLGFCIPVLPIIVWRARRAGIDERRRVALLVAGLCVGLIPTFVWVFLEAAWPGFARDVLPLSRAGWVIYPTLLSTPLTTAYAVLVRRALNVRVVVRRALQYALARYSAMVGAAIPVVLLAVSLYRHRLESVASLLSTPSQLALGIVAIVGVITLRRRSQVLARIDRLFFREQYDARHILGELVDRCRGAEDWRQLAHTLRATIDRVLHVNTVTVLFLDSDGHMLASPEGEVRPIRADAAVPQLAARSNDWLDVDLERYGHFDREIPEDELHWIVDGGFNVVLPLRDTDRQLIGLLALGEKKSELPFSSEDQKLLMGIASAAAMAIAYRNLRPKPVKESAVESIAAVAGQVAAECMACGSVQPSGRDQCVRCGGDTTNCVLPQVVGGKFLLDERIGAGAMGVVYRGMDVHLGRLVAIKTLPTLSPGEAVRLRREARAMASVSHRNLATIFGAETWQGRPLLVCEYLAGGTLAHRLERCPLAVPEMIEIGLALASVLGAIHRAGVLHRDIKPSNIGFSAEGVPKLLDFGIARILTVVSSPSPAPRGMPGVSDDEVGLTVATESAMRGTPLYMSPEALHGASPDASFDLWSLALVLYEAVVGRHPLLPDPESASSRTRHRRAEVPNLLSLDPTASATVANFFAKALAPNREHRPQTAEELHDLLTQLSSAGSDDDVGGVVAGHGMMRPLFDVERTERRGGG